MNLDLTTLALTGLISTNGFVLFLLGRVTAQQKAAHDMNAIAMLASLWATVEAKGLQRSTVIQRIVEKYHPAVARATSPDALAEMERRFEEDLGLSDPEPKKRKGTHADFMATYDFDEEAAKDNAKDLV